MLDESFGGAAEEEMMKPGVTVSRGNDKVGRNTPDDRANLIESWRADDRLRGAGQTVFLGQSLQSQSRTLPCHFQCVGKCHRDCDAGSVSQDGVSKFLDIGQVDRRSQSLP